MITSMLIVNIFLSGVVFCKINVNNKELFDNMKVQFKNSKYVVLINGGKYTDRPEFIDMRPTGIDVPVERVVVFFDPMERSSSYINKLYFYPISYKDRIMSTLTLAQDCRACEAPYYYGETNEYLIIVNESWMFSSVGLNNSEFNISLKKYLSEFK